jgi:hypothetical protein
VMFVPVPWIALSRRLFMGLTHTKPNSSKSFL